MTPRQSPRQDAPIDEARHLISHWKAYASWAEQAPGIDPWGIWSASLRAKLVAIRGRLERDLARGLSPLIDSRQELLPRLEHWRLAAEELEAKLGRLLLRIPWCGLPVLRPEVVHEVQVVLRNASRVERDARELVQLTTNLDLGASG
jgi:hypothetical protein